MNWEKADEISDRIIDLMNARLMAGVDPLQLFAGQLLGLVGFMKTAPLAMAPDSFMAVGQAAMDCLHDMLVKGEDKPNG